MDTPRRSFALHLPGLLKVLAEHLYSQRQVALRELIQNAHDSIQKRRLVETDSSWRPRIDVRVDTSCRRLVVEDNGCGLTETEVVDYLATIGRSGTRETREGLALRSPEEAAQLIGQFGFGFLSAFLLASEVTVESRSIQPGAAPVRWTSTGEAEYDLAAGSRDEPGTTITLTGKPEAAYLVTPIAVEAAIARFADFLPIPIHLDDGLAPANLGSAPWESHDPESAGRAYVQRSFQVAEPLCILPLRDDDVPTASGETVRVSLRGLLFVPPGSVASVREWGDLSVYIRRMFIRDSEKHLLPPWARFVRGVIDCPDLQPTASREDIHQDAAFDLVRRSIERQLADGLRRIAHESPGTWRRVVDGHTDVLTGWAVRDDAFFDQIADLLRVRTSRGPMTLPEYLDAAGGDRIYFVTRELGSLQERMLAESRGVPVVDASWFAVAPLLEKWANRQRDVSLIALDADADALLRPTEPGALTPLLDYFDRQGVFTRVATFAPAEAPALIVFPPHAEFVKESADALSSGEIADPLAALIGDFVALKAARTPAGGTLYLNAANPLVGRLAAMAPGAARDAALTVVLQTARLFSGRMLSAGDAAEAFGAIGTALERLTG